MQAVYAPTGQSYEEDRGGHSAKRSETGRRQSRKPMSLKARKRRAGFRTSTVAT